MAEMNMYNNQIQFRLVSQMADFPFNNTIEEPINVRSSNYIIQRDLAYFGFAAQFMDDNARLEFDNTDNSGRAIIEQIYAKYGNDGIILFFIEIFTAGVWVPIVRANLNLTEFQSNSLTCSCSIEKTNFDNKFRTRYEVAFMTDQILDMDNHSLTALPTMGSIQMQAQKQRKVLTTNQEPDTVTVFNYTGAARNTIGIFASDNVILNQFTGNAGLATVVEQFSLTQNPAVEIAAAGYCQFTAEKMGLANIVMSNPSFLFHGYAGTQTQNHYSTWSIGLYSVVFDKLGGVIAGNTHYHENIVHTMEINETWRSWSQTNLSVYLNVGDRVCFYLSCYRLDTPGSEVTSLGNLSLTLSITQDEDDVDSYVQVWDFKSVLKYGLKNVTGSDNVVSSLMDSFNKRIALTNGACIAGLGTLPSRHLKLTIKQLFDSLQAIWNIGYTITTDDSGNDLMVIEPFDYFFQNKMITTITEVYDYTESWDKDLLFNYLQIGYEKYTDDITFGLDAFNTYMEYLLPMVSFSKTLTRKSPITADGYSIEKVRQYKYNTDYAPYFSTFSEDDNLYFLCLDSTLKTSVDDSNTNLLNVIDSVRAFNYRISPVRMLYNHLSYINSVLAKKQGTDVIQNRTASVIDLVLHNLTISGSLKGLSASQQNGVQLTENQNFFVDNSKKLFTPILSIFDCNLDYIQFVLIRDALLNKGENANGYVQIYTPKGIICIFVKKITYNPITQIAGIEGWQKI